MTFRRIRSSAPLPIGARVDLSGVESTGFWIVDAIEDDPLALWAIDYGDDDESASEGEMTPDSYIVVLKLEES
jgi:hypothetical protein